MGSNVFKLPGAGLFRPSVGRADTESANASSQVSLLSAFAVPSFRRRPVLPQAQAALSGEHWASLARRRAALRLVESPCATALSAHPSQPLLPPQPLRVMRLVEAGQAPGTAGRLRLSGRLADVCAELDRMAAAESGAGSHALRA